jgi:alpha-galactosidase
MSLEMEAKTVLATAEAWDAGAPVINGPERYGASPGKDFLYAVPALGERPVRFSAEGLPAGLAMDPCSGLITGRVALAGSFRILLTAENRHGKASKEITLEIGENRLALTPPLGWNSWNCFRSEINEARIDAIARGMIRSGLAARGYSYVNLDSGWQSKQRGGRFNSIVPHEGFPDMGALAARLHGLGLKMGIYSGPYVIPWGTEGCGSTSGPMDTRFTRFPRHVGKYIGMVKHEAEDVAQWADWGIDYFKYDWHHTDMEMAARMSQALRGAARDIVYSVTTRVPFADAAEAARLCNLWRSNDDTHPGWDSIVKNGFGNDAWNPYIGPGHWFDLDMTAILPRDGKRLTEDELIGCFTRWAIRPSPLLVDCVPDEMDAFTRNLLCNEEVLAVNQDILGKPAATVLAAEGHDVQLKPLSDGGYAVGFFNLSEAPAVLPELDFAAFGLPGELRVRDLWAKRDLPGRRTKLAAAVAPHCARLFRVFP